MSTCTRTALVATLTASLLLAASAAPAAAEAPGEALAGWLDESRPLRVGWDLLGLRPFDAVTFVGSGAVGIVALPVSWLTGGSATVKEACFQLPWRRLARPLGAL